VTPVGWGALFVAVAGGLYGFFINGLTTVIMGFIERLACGFIFFYISAQASWSYFEKRRQDAS
jgi:hypothetical protein